MEYPEMPSGVPATGGSVSEHSPPSSPLSRVAQFEVDASKTTSNYANFCRLSGTPEELLIDFGLNSQATPLTTQPIEVSQRIVTGWHTAKRLLQVLQLTVERHEAAFGVLETDVRKRIGRK